MSNGEEEILNGLRQSKSRCKAVFTRCRHQLLVLLDEVDMPSSGGSRIWWKGASTRAKCSRHKVVSGRGSGRGCPASPDGKKMEIRKCLEDFWSTPKYVFCKAILYINIDKTHLSTIFFLHAPQGYFVYKYWQNTSFHHFLSARPQFF